MNENNGGPNVVVLGVTGAGKSTLCNVLTGKTPNGEDEDGFPSSASPNTCTYKTVGKRANWLGNYDKPLTICDTPGLGDPSGRDSLNIVDMVEVLKDIKHVNAFIIVFNGQNPRIDLNLKSILQLFQKIFGKDFINNVIIQFSRWSFDKRSIKVRAASGTGEETQAESWNQRFQQELGATKDLPVVFVDALRQEDDVDEIKAFKEQTDLLWEAINTLEPYECKDFEAVLTENDELRLKVEEARVNEKIASMY